MTNSLPDRVLILFNANHTMETLRIRLQQWQPTALWLISKPADRVAAARTFRKSAAQELSAHYRTIVFHDCEADLFSLPTLLQCVGFIRSQYPPSATVLLDIKGGTTMAATGLYASQLFDLHVVHKQRLMTQLNYLPIPQLPIRAFLTKANCWVLYHLAQYLQQSNTPTVSKSAFVDLFLNQDEYHRWYAGKIVKDYRKLNQFLLEFIRNDVLDITRDNRVDLTPTGEFIQEIFKVYYGFEAYTSPVTTQPEVYVKRKILITPFLTTPRFIDRLTVILERVHPEVVYIIYQETQFQEQDLVTALSQLVDLVDIELLPQNYYDLPAILEFLADLFHAQKQDIIYLNIMGGTHITIAFSYAALLFHGIPVFPAFDRSTGKIRFTQEFLRLADQPLEASVSPQEIRILGVLQNFFIQRNQKLIGKQPLFDLLANHDLVDQQVEGSTRYYQLRSVLQPFIAKGFIAEKGVKYYLTDKGRLTARVFQKYYFD